MCFFVLLNALCHLLVLSMYATEQYMLFSFIITVALYVTVLADFMKLGRSVNVVFPIGQSVFLL